MSLSFAVLCGKCFRSVPTHSGGSVLSCGDIICSTCANTCFESSSRCPACDKEGVKALVMNESLPEEVRRNFADTSKELESFYDIILFQVKYYKKLTKQMIGRLNKMNQECENHKRLIAELENQIQNQNDTSGHRRPRFSSGQEEEGVVWISNQEHNPQQLRNAETERFQGNRRPPSSSSTHSGNAPSTPTSSVQQHNFEFRDPPTPVSHHLQAGMYQQRPDDATPYKEQLTSSPYLVMNRDESGLHQLPQRMQTPTTQPGLLGKRTPQQPANNFNTDQYPHNSPRLGGVNFGRDQQAPSTPNVQQTHHDSRSVVSLSPGGAGMSMNNRNRLVGTPMKQLPPPLHHSLNNRPLSAKGRGVNSPGINSRVRSPHVPIVRSPLLISPNKGVNVAQSPSQMVRNAAMQMQEQRSAAQAQQDQQRAYMQFIGDDGASSHR